MASIEELEAKIKDYEMDRFCQGGCAVYQYDKLQKHAQYFQQISNLCQSVKECLDIGKECNAMNNLDEIQRICCEAENYGKL